jgi:hypothetical protein
MSWVFLICVHLRSSAAYKVLGGFCRKLNWPRMNADEKHINALTETVLSAVFEVSNTRAHGPVSELFASLWPDGLPPGQFPEAQGGVEANRESLPDRGRAIMIVGL